jgi:D-alanyl-D-alanine carboxypeptidase
MLKEFLLSLFVLATTSGLTFPQVLQQERYTIPTYAEADMLSYQRARKPLLVAVPVRKEDNAEIIIQSKAALIMDEASGAILWQKNEAVPLPIASVTKLMTALVAKEHITDWEATYAYTAKENALGGAEVAVGTGDMFTKRDILKTALVASANNAAAALAHSTGLTQEDFVREMNKKAQQLGMTSTEYIEPTGLNEGNISTVKDLALLMRTVGQQTLLMEPLGSTEHKMTRRNENTGNEVVVHTTNRLIKNHDPYVLAGKTGFTYEAMHCLVTLATDEADNRIIVALLGGPDATVRFEETQALIRWTYENYQWK